MRTKWFLPALLCGVAMVLMACGGSATPAPTCGAQVCVVDIRTLRVDAATVAIFFQMTEADGSLEPANPPAFANGLHVRIADQTGDLRLLDRDYAPDAFSCVADDQIPGAEGSVTAACILTLTNADFATLPEPGSTVMLAVYGDTFPVMLSQLTFP